jgi:hypothetical protein
MQLPTDLNGHPANAHITASSADPVSQDMRGLAAAYSFLHTHELMLTENKVSYFWKQWDGEHEGYCNNFQLAVYINSGINIFFDLVVFFLPIPKLMQIQVQDKRRKAGVVLTFLVGLFVTACSMVRLKYSSGVSKITNATYDYTDISLWSGIECEVGVICACMVSHTKHRAFTLSLSPPLGQALTTVLPTAHLHRPHPPLLQRQLRLQTLLFHKQQIRRHQQLSNPHLAHRRRRFPRRQEAAQHHQRRRARIRRSSGGARRAEARRDRADDDVPHFARADESGRCSLGASGVQE